MRSKSPPPKVHPSRIYSEHVIDNLLSFSGQIENVRMWLTIFLQIGFISVGQYYFHGQVKVIGDTYFKDDYIAGIIATFVVCLATFCIIILLKIEPIDKTIEYIENAIIVGLKKIQFSNRIFDVSRSKYMLKNYRSPPDSQMGEIRISPFDLERIKNNDKLVTVQVISSFKEKLIFLRRLICGGIILLVILVRYLATYNFECDSGDFDCRIHPNECRRNDCNMCAATLYVDFPHWEAKTQICTYPNGTYLVYTIYGLIFSIICLIILMNYYKKLFKTYLMKEKQPGETIFNTPIKKYNDPPQENESEDQKEDQTEDQTEDNYQIVTDDK